MQHGSTSHVAHVAAAHHAVHQGHLVPAAHQGHPVLAAHHSRTHAAAPHNAKPGDGRGWDRWFTGGLVSSDDVTAAGQRWDSIDVTKACTSALAGKVPHDEASAICTTAHHQSVRSHAFSPALSAIYSRLTY